MHQGFLQKKVVLRMRQTELVKRIVTPTKKSECKKGACNEARSTEEENVIMRESTDEEENQLPKCGRKGDAKILIFEKG